MLSRLSPASKLAECLLFVAPILVAAAACHKTDPPPPAPAAATEVRIAVDATGYHPAQAHAPGGKPVRLVVTRTSAEGCGDELVIPSADIKRALPVGEAVVIDVTMPTSGELAFTCGMDMLRGAIVAD